MEMFLTAEFWLAVGQIILIDILLGGDNAVVIALACRSLPPAQRRKGILWGTAGAIVLRVVLIFFALTLLKIPFIKLVGAVLLVWIGIKLLQPEEEVHDSIEGSTHLLGAIRTIIIADAVMSLDNVIAVAAAAKGDLGLVVFGILVSIPIVVWGSKFVLKLMDRLPVVITFGGALLGWIAGDMLLGDAVVKPYLEGQPGWLKYAASTAGALLVMAIGTWLAKRAPRPQPPVEVVASGAQGEREHE